MFNNLDDPVDGLLLQQDSSNELCFWCEIVRFSLSRAMLKLLGVV